MQASLHSCFWVCNFNSLSMHIQAERRMLLDQQLYPPNIAETLAALQRVPESSMQASGSSRYTLQV